MRPGKKPDMFDVAKGDVSLMDYLRSRYDEWDLKRRLPIAASTKVEEIFKPKKKQEEPAAEKPSKPAAVSEEKEQEVPAYSSTPSPIASPSEHESVLVIATEDIEEVTLELEPEFDPEKAQAVKDFSRSVRAYEVRSSWQKLSDWWEQQVDNFYRWVAKISRGE